MVSVGTKHSENIASDLFLPKPANKNQRYQSKEKILNSREFSEATFIKLLLCSRNVYISKIS